MMHGYGYDWGDMMSSSSTFFNPTGWMVVSMMGISLLLIVAVVAWFVWTQRSSLGFNGPQTGVSQLMNGPSHGVEPPSHSPSEAVEQIVRRRYANGEIDTAEYKAMMATLKEQ